MSIMKTDLRETVENARRIRFEPTAPFTATNVQDAIVQAHTLPNTLGNTTRVTFAMSPYAPLSTDFILLVDTNSGGPITINLPAQAARGGIPLAVKDDTGNAGANPISLVCVGGESVDGLSTYPLDSNYVAAQLNPQTGGYFIAP